MHHFRASLPKWVLTSSKKTTSHIFKMTIFQKIFEAFMRHIIKWNTDKKLKFVSELFTNKIFEMTIVIFISKQSSLRISISTVFSGSQKPYMLHIRGLPVLDLLLPSQAGNLKKSYHWRSSLYECFNWNEAEFCFCQQSGQPGLRFGNSIRRNGTLIVSDRKLNSIAEL